MAGSLIKITETTVTSAVATVTLTGIDSTYDVYMMKMNNALLDTDASTIFFRVTTSGTADSDSEYDRAYKVLRTSTSFANVSSTNQTSWAYNTLGTAGNEQGNVVMYLFNFNNSSEYSFITVEESTFNTAQQLTGRQGGGVHTVAQACDGLHFYMESSVNINAGARFVLYGLKK